VKDNDCFYCRIFAFQRNVYPVYLQSVRTRRGKRAYMEIDLSTIKQNQKMILWIVTTCLLIAGLALLGRYYTTGERVLTWQEWQIRKAERLNASEKELLCQQTEKLAEVLSDESEPVRAALVAQTALNKTQSVKSPTLDVQRQAVADASQAVSDWGAGLIDYNAAVEAVTTALQMCR